MECVVCGSDFISNYKHKRTCSEACSIALMKLNRARWVDENRVYFNSYKRDYHQKKDKVKQRERTKQYRKSEQGRKVRKEQQRRRLARDPVYKAKRALRKRLWSYKKRLGSISMSKSIGCTWDHFKSYMEDKFYPNPKTGEMMSWTNYGKGGWEIDHMVPLCTAKTTEDLEKLSHYTNLQPLWADDNNLKSLDDSKMKI